jgi:toxin ParE1/3/4
VSSRPLILHPAALAEVVEAKAFYKARDSDVALEFEELVSIALDRIELAPERWPPYLDGTHRYLLHRFPYAIIYDVHPASVRVLAIAHQRRRPSYWARRLAT